MCVKLHHSETLEQLNISEHLEVSCRCTDPNPVEDYGSKIQTFNSTFFP